MALPLCAAGCSVEAEHPAGLFAKLTGDFVEPDAAASSSSAGDAEPTPMGADGSSASAADGGTPASDASVELANAMMLDIDAATEMPDAATSDPDAAAEMSDAAMPDSDAAMEMSDAATPDSDAAIDAPDAPTPDPDASIEMPDAAIDAGLDHDAMPMDPDDASTDPDAALPDPADEHCAMEMPADPRDSMIESSEPVIWSSGRSRDVLLPQPVIDWINEQGLQEAHNAWHMTRRWDDLCGTSFAPAASCEFAQSLVEVDLWRAEYQQGAPGAGVAFLHMHRHMIHMFRSTFPAHADLFDGWSHVPRSRDDTENPTPWKDITWNTDNLIGFDILEHIEDHLDLFANEDELGVFIESTFRWTPEEPVVSLGIEGSGVHGALHNQWTVSRSPADLGRTDTAIPNYVFWKLHGFIDDVWSRYRIAKHLHDEDTAYRQVAREECRLMYYLAPAHRPEPPPATDTNLKRGE
jgi:hypothetical protein